MSSASASKTHKDKSEKTSRNMGTKFQEVQRKWGGLVSPPPGMLVSETEESDSEFYHRSAPKSPKFITGCNTVKSLSGRFGSLTAESISSGRELDSLDSLTLENAAEVLKTAVTDQRREIDTLRAEMATKDAKIRQLEETLTRITGSPQGPRY